MPLTNFQLLIFTLFAYLLINIPVVEIVYFEKKSSKFCKESRDFIGLLQDGN